ncbi:MAG: anti-sigma factor family protein [Acidobacteriaceae bacterium]
MSCRQYKNRLSDLLFEPEKVPAVLRLHVEQCAACREELSALRSTMSLLNEWHAPEPSPYFDTRMAARLRAEREAAPAGFFERLRTRMLYGNSMHLKPLIATTLTLILLIGAGTYADLMRQTHMATQEQASATIQDLQSLDRNAQLFEQMDQLLQDDGQANGSGAGSASTLNP